MRKAEYREGREAWDNFKRGMERLFKIPKSAVMNPKQAEQSTTSRKPKRADKD